MKIVPILKVQNKTQLYYKLKKKIQKEQIM